jgi:hypothetical protein
VALALAGLGRFGMAVDSPVQADRNFEARLVSGKVVRGPLQKVLADWSISLGKGPAKRIAGDEIVSLRQVGVALPPLPTDEHLLLVNGDRIPLNRKSLNLDGEKLQFQHPDLSGGKAVSVPLTMATGIWRVAPEGTVSPEKHRRELAAGTRARDTVLLRNGDRISGVLNKLDDKGLEVEVDKKPVRAKIDQVAAIGFSTELAEKRPFKGVFARLVLTETEKSPGGRFTLVSALCEDGRTLRGKTNFGAIIRVPLARVAALDLSGGRIDYLSDLKPTKYEYKPCLDETWPWAADGNAAGRDLRLAGSVYGKGLGVHAASSLTFALAGKYERFEALVGLDDLDGRKGTARIRVLADGKPLDLGGKELTFATGPLALNLPVKGVKELTLETGWGRRKNVQGVVNWVDARLIKTKLAKANE